LSGPVEVSEHLAARRARLVSPDLTEAEWRRLRHDLRTPLTIVTGFAEFLAADRQISDADRREYAARIQAATAEIRELLDELLEDD
jgi:signal transduction histidine kinase